MNGPVLSFEEFADQQSVREIGPGATSHKVEGCLAVSVTTGSSSHPSTLQWLPHQKRLVMDMTAC